MQRQGRWVVAAAVLFYCLIGALYIAQNPGLNYDEALLVLGGVELRHPGQIQAFHERGTWQCLFGFCFPVMTVAYVGALKEYLIIPFFALFGTSAAVVRLCSLLLGALGIWGIGRLLREHVSTWVAAGVCGVMAVSPAYVALTIFDQGTVSIWMASLGLLSLAVTGYLRKPSPAAAFWIGAAMGLGVWARANYVWIIAAMLGAAILGLHKRLGKPISHWIAWTGGGLLGGAPFLIYNLLTQFATLDAGRLLTTAEPFRTRFTVRLVMFSEALLVDREHRAMWQGTGLSGLPDWQRGGLAALVIIAGILCLLQWRSLWPRFVAIASMIYATALFTTRNQIAEHHLVGLLPFAALLVALAASSYVRGLSGRAVVVVLAAAYLVMAAQWHFRSITGLARTGGVGQWSNAITAVGEHLEREYPKREVKIIDWGLRNNLFVLTDGRVPAKELFWDASEQRSGLGRAWSEEVREGGIFLTNGPTNQMVPACTRGFLKALEQIQPVAKRTTIPQRSGVPYAEIIEVLPNTGKLPDATRVTSSVSTGDPEAAGQLEGFYHIEESGWRWTKREFAVTLASPGTDARLVMKLYVPPVVLEQVGPVTLTARAGGVVLASQTYSTTGPYTFAIGVKAGLLRPGNTRFEFALDKAIQPNSRDPRELGVVVNSVALESAR
jgi:hypothetical protein